MGKLLFIIVVVLLLGGGAGHLSREVLGCLGLIFLAGLVLGAIVVLSLLSHPFPPLYR